MSDHEDETPDKASDPNGTAPQATISRQTLVGASAATGLGPVAGTAHPQSIKTIACNPRLIDDVWGRRTINDAVHLP